MYDASSGAVLASYTFAAPNVAFINDVPTTVAAFGPLLYVVNARFNTPPTSRTPYSVVRVRAR